MHGKAGFFFSCLIFLILLTFPGPLRAEKAAIRDFLVTNNESHLLVYARVIDCFTARMEAAILAGVPTTFTFIIDLFRERPWWPDRKLIRLTVRHMIKYDNVKKIFHVSFDGNREHSVFQDFDSAKRAMADLSGVPVVPLETLKSNEYYEIDIKAKLDKVRLPLHLEVVFFFVSLWDFETDWYRERFFY